MKIIDKNIDFYDYLQGIYRDFSVTFDRTDSFVLTKELMCSSLHRARDNLYRIGNNSYETGTSTDSRFVLLQVCNTFWLSLAKITKKDSYDMPLDYEMELLTSWKNYCKKRELIKLDIISFGWKINRQICKSTNITSQVDVLTQAIDMNDYRVRDSVNKCIVRKAGNTYEEKHIPIFKASGMAKCIDPLEIYLSLEEYFLLEKSSLERVSSINITDKEKIENHGFDVKTSFRGK